MSREFFSGGATNLSAAAIPDLAKPLVLSTWFNVNSIGVDQTLFGFHGGTDRKEIYINATGNLVINEVSQGIPRSAITTTSATLNKWHHVVAYMPDDITRIIWLDGGGRGVLGFSIVPAIGINQTNLGRRVTNAIPGNYFNGLLAHTAVWCGLTFNDEMALDLARGVNPLRWINYLESYWPLWLKDDDPGENDLAKRQIFLNNDGTIHAEVDPPVQQYWPKRYVHVPFVTPTIVSTLTFKNADLRGRITFPNADLRGRIELEDADLRGRIVFKGPLKSDN